MTKFFLALLLLHLSALCRLGLATRQVRRKSAAKPQLATPHVTRLHRHEHGGLSAMLEAEARWESLSEEEPLPGASSFLEMAGSTTEVAAQRRFSRVSTQQMTWLREHQLAAFAQLDSNSRGSATASGQTKDAGSAGSNLRAVRTHRQHARAAEEESEGGTVASAVTSLSSLEVEYVGPVGVGTRRQAPEGGAALSQSSPDSSQSHTEESEIWMVFDTGSVNIWVSSDLCTEGACAKAGRNRYNHSRSETYEMKHTTLEVKFGTGTLTGPLAVDDFHIGPFTVHNQTFAMIEKMEGAVFDAVPLEGILGLAFPSMAAPGNVPFFDTIINQNALPHNQFAFYFSVDNPAANAVLWGGVDDRFYSGEIEYFPVVDSWYWSIVLKSFRIGDDVLVGNTSDDESNNNVGNGTASLVESTAMEASTFKAIIDTGTTFITAGEELYKQILEKIPACPCSNVTKDSHPSLVFQLENEDGEPKDFVLEAHEYMTTDGNGENCSPVFMKLEIAGDHGPGMILGDVFLRRFFSVFDRGDGESHNGRVGFARATHGEHVDRHLKKLTKGQPKFNPGAKA